MWALDSIAAALKIAGDKATPPVAIAAVKDKKRGKPKLPPSI
jgi:hypothetical protein